MNERQFPGLGLDKPAVESEKVQVNIQIQGAAVSLDKGNGASLSVWLSLCASEASDARAQGAREGSMHGRAERVVVGKAVSQWVWKAQYPLPTA